MMEASMSDDDSDEGVFTAAFIKNLVFQRAADLMGGNVDLDELEEELSNIAHEGEGQSDSEGSEEWVEDDGDCTQQAYRQNLHSALKSVYRPGSFYAEGTLAKFGLPGLEVTKLGPIGLPLSAAQAEQLAARCLAGKFGRWEATVYDPSVPPSPQRPPTHFRLRGREWEAQIHELANGDIKRGLGVPENVTVVPQLDKLLLYDPGTFFGRHSTSKEDGVFGTLVVVLPSLHQGGELVLGHGEHEAVLDFGAKYIYAVHCAAYYADCICEILPIKSGNQLVLEYKLVAKGGYTEDLVPVDNTRAVTATLAAIREWSEDADGPSKLVLPLKHKYSSKSLSFDALKGVDIATVDMLRQAAQVPDRTPFHFFLGMLKHMESGEEDFDEEECETSLELSHMLAPPGETARYTKLEVDENELEPEGAFDVYEWDEERTLDNGGEGRTVERWSRHAALVVWPHSRHWDVACDYSISKALKEAASVAQSAVAAHAALEESLAASGQLSPGDAALVVDLVWEHGHVAALEEMRLALRTLCRSGDRLKHAQGQMLTKLLVKHGDVEMAKSFLHRFPSPAESPIVSTLASHFGWATLEDDVISLLERLRVAGRLDDSFKLLLSILSETAAYTSSRKRSAAAEKVSGKNDAGIDQQGGTRLDNRTPESVRAESGGSVVSANPQSAPTKAEQPAQPRQPTKQEQEREALCRRAIAAIVETLPHQEMPRGHSLGIYVPGITPRSGPLGSALNTRSMPLLIRLIERFGAELFAPATDVLIRARVTCSLVSAADLLWEFIQGGYAKRATSGPPDLSPAALAFCRQFGTELTACLVRQEDPPPGQRNSCWSYGRPPCHSDLAATTLKALCVLDIDQKLIQSVVAYFVASPVFFPAATALVPAFENLVDFFGKGSPRASCFAELIWAAVTGLEDRWAAGPPKAKDWALPAQSECSCESCKELLMLCHDATQTRMLFRAPLPELEHMRDVIEKYDMPLTASLISDLTGLRLACIKKGWTEGGDEQALATVQIEKGRYEDDKKAITRLLKLGSQLEVEESESNFDFDARRSTLS